MTVWEQVTLNRGRHGSPWLGRNNCLGLEDVKDSAHNTWLRMLAEIGSKDRIPFSYLNERGRTFIREHAFEGIITNLERRYRETESTTVSPSMDVLMIGTAFRRCWFSA